MMINAIQYVLEITIIFPVMIINEQ